MTIPRTAFVSLLLVSAACSGTPTGEDIGSTAAAVSGVNGADCSQYSVYDCRLSPASQKGTEANRVADDNGGVSWGIQSGNWPLLDGDGNNIGTEHGGALTFNYGQQRTFTEGGATGLYVFALSSSNGSTGWLPTSSLSDWDSFKAHVGDVSAKDEGLAEGGCYEVLSGLPSGVNASDFDDFEALKVVHDSTSSEEKVGNYTSWKRSDGKYLANMLYNVTIGSPAIDIFPAGTKFRLLEVPTWKEGQHSLDMDLWKKNGQGRYLDHAGQLKFYYGRVTTPAGDSRIGWMAYEGIGLSIHGKSTINAALKPSTGCPSTPIANPRSNAMANAATRDLLKVFKDSSGIAGHDRAPYLYYYDDHSLRNGSKTVGYWVFSQAIDATVDAIVREPSDAQGFKDSVKDMFDWQGDYGWGAFFDDESWMGLALAHAFVATGNRDYLERATKLLEDIYTAGRAHPKDAGIWWDRAHTEEATASNFGPVILGEFLLSLDANGWVSAHDISTTYTNWWDHMVNSETGQVYDHRVYGGRCSDSRTQVGDECRVLFSYNQGLAIGASLAMYELYKGEDGYLKNAELAANFLVDKFTVDTTSRATGVKYGPVLHDTACSGDCDGFKGITYRYLLDLYHLDKNAKYGEVLSASAKAIWALAHHPRNDTFEEDWSSPDEDASSRVSLGADASAVMSLNMAVKFGQFDDSDL